MTKVSGMVIIIYVENCTQKYKVFKTLPPANRWLSKFKKLSDKDPKGTWVDHIVNGTVHFV